jgi:hypothetical protein
MLSAGSVLRCNKVFQPQPSLTPGGDAPICNFIQEAANILRHHAVARCSFRLRTSQRGRVVRATRWPGVSDVADVVPVVPAYSPTEICRASAFFCFGVADSFSTTTEKACILRSPGL